MELEETRDVFMSFDGQNIMLSISRIKLDASGTYKVVAKNQFGSSECSAQLTVNGMYDGVLSTYTHRFYIAHYQ